MDFEELVPPLWHAFNSLDGQQAGNGLKQQLKVLAFAVAGSLGLTVDKENLEEYKEHETVTFENFSAFLKKEVFEKTEEMSDNNANKELHNPDIIPNICWDVCQKSYKEFTRPLTIGKEELQKLWRVFNSLSEVGSDDTHVRPIVVHRDEAELVIKKMLLAIGKMYDKDMLEDVSDELDFQQYIELVNRVCCKGLDAETISETVQKVYAEFILQILKKGLLEKKSPGTSFHAYTTRWFVLRPTELVYYHDKDEKELKGQIMLTKNCRTMVITTQKRGKAHRFNLGTEGRNYELCAPDALSRTEWLNVLNIAIESSSKPYGPQKLAWLKRRNERKAAQDKQKQEEARRLADKEMIEQKQKELEETQRAKDALETSMNEELQKKNEIIARLRQIEEERKKLEEQLSKETLEKDSYQQKLKVLEEESGLLRSELNEHIKEKDIEHARRLEVERINVEVKAALAQEEQARRDEEIVRNQATLALKEELEKREQLEKLKEEQEKELEEQKLKNKDLEEIKQAQEEVLEQERQKLEELTIEKEKKNLELEEAQAKMTAAEKAKEDVEKKVKDTQNPAFRQLLMERIYREHLEGTPEIISHRGKGAFTVAEFENLAEQRKAELTRTQSENSAENFVEEGNKISEENESESEEIQTNNSDSDTEQK